MRDLRQTRPDPGASLLGLCAPASPRRVFKLVLQRPIAMVLVWIHCTSQRRAGGHHRQLVEPLRINCWRQLGAVWEIEPDFWCSSGYAAKAHPGLPARPGQRRPPCCQFPAAQLRQLDTTYWSLITRLRGMHSRPWPYGRRGLDGRASGQCGISEIRSRTRKAKGPESSKPPTNWRSASRLSPTPWHRRRHPSECPTVQAGSVSTCVAGHRRVSSSIRPVFRFCCPTVDYGHTAATIPSAILRAASSTPVSTIPNLRPGARYWAAGHSFSSVRPWASTALVGPQQRGWGADLTPVACTRSAPRATQSATSLPTKPSEPSPQPSRRDSGDLCVETLRLNALRAFRLVSERPSIAPSIAIRLFD